MSVNSLLNADGTLNRTFLPNVMNYRGLWSITRQYFPNDVVSDSVGSWWVATIPTVVISPATYPTSPNWLPLANTNVYNMKYSTPTDNSVFVRQPFIQYGTKTGASTASGNVSVTLPYPYSSQSTYVVLVTMEDDKPANVSCNIVDNQTFTIYWTNGTNNPQILAWTSFGT